MKIAITSKGRDLESEVDPRFGRAAFIIIVDPDTLQFDVLDNSTNVNAFKGAGIQAASMISESGADVLLTGYCGPNAFRTLQAAGIKVADNVGGYIRESLARFQNGEFQFAAEPNTDGHW
jgi:predicted Fe-Mo cluster-binding NifX family protein